MGVQWADDIPGGGDVDGDFAAIDGVPGDPGPTGGDHIAALSLLAG